MDIVPLENVSLLLI